MKFSTLIVSLAVLGAGFSTTFLLANEALAGQFEFESLPKHTQSELPIAYNGRGDNSDDDNWD